MAEVSKIEWCDSTFNPWIGCTKVSAACDHCYAETYANRWKLVTWGKPGQEGDRKRTSDALWRKVYSWQTAAYPFRLDHGRRQRVFCASLADWLDNQVPAEWRKDLCDLIKRTPDLDWLLLTKRPQNLRKLVPTWAERGMPANVWFGTTAEDAKTYAQRFPHVARVKAGVRFISYEPALGPLGPLDLGDGIVPDWVISGGESGGGARVTRPAWVREVQRECKKHGTAFFHKQWGNYHSNPIVIERRLSIAEAERRDPKVNGKGGALLDGQLWRAFPERRAV